MTKIWPKYESVSAAEILAACHILHGQEHGLVAMWLDV